MSGLPPAVSLQRPVKSPHKRLSQSKAVPNDVELAVRLLSETGHDLRGPLASIRESIQLVLSDCNGIPDSERELLTAVQAEADRMTQMVSDMTQLERLRTGIPRVQRQWISIQQLRQQIVMTLEPWIKPRRISVLWDGGDSLVNVFVDRAAIQRLIVNLVGNSVRAIGEGSTILIKLAAVRSGDAIRWSVIDQGPGISPSDLSRLSTRFTTLAGGEGLGLAICRQLAAIHFSALTIRSRVGYGTEVWFETAAVSPRAVANVWAAWRESFREPKRRPESRTGQSRDTTQRHEDLGMRLDPPVAQVTLTGDLPAPRSADRLAMGWVSIDASADKAAADAFDLALQNMLRMYDFVYRLDMRRWIWVLDEDARHCEERLQWMRDQLTHLCAAVKVTWSDPQLLVVDSQRLALIISDMLVRHSLLTTGSTLSDGNEVRLGTPPLEPSLVPTQRLDEELQRLSTRLRHQTNILQKSASQMRRHD
jgi:hypothetical protein